MTESPDSIASDALDNQASLPGKNWLSVGLVLVVQALNSFNDNFVKMLLISLAITVASGTFLGDNMEILLPVIFSVPYVIFAPTAGWLSDRWSKKTVIVWMQIAQIICFIFLGIVLWIKDPYWSLLLGLIGFFVLATQAAFFSPAKMGIMKELAGSRRLGMVSGWLQMTMMGGVLSGIFAGGLWYKYELQRSHDAWWSALMPLGVIGLLCLGELAASMLVQPSPEHKDIKFQRSLFWEHFGQVKLVFKYRPVRLAAIGIIFFWFISNSIGMIVVSLAKELNPDPSQGGSAEEIGKLAGTVGVGVVLGSFLASGICRRRIELGMIPFAGLGMMTGLLWTGFATGGSLLMYAGLAFTGIAGGCFMVPLYAFVQDRSAPEERARILAGINLMDCTGVFLVGAFVLGMKALGLSAASQFKVLAVPSFIATIYISKLLPKDLVRFMCLAVVRSIYRVRGVHAERVPRTGGVLLLPNHVSYMDAMVVAVACNRPVRYVIWDSLYNQWWLTAFLRLFGTVPISATRAKDAIRTVAEALRNGEVVCIFPEGQLTRVGAMNEIRKGFELMVRQANVPAVPVYQDGLWGSFFSHEGAGCFNKLPKSLPYAVTIRFGNPIPPREAKASRVRDELFALASESLCARNPKATLNEMNDMRLGEVIAHDGTKRYTDAATGAVIAVHLPNPPMPDDSDDIQLGTLPGTLGRILPGLIAKATPQGLEISGLAPGDDRVALIPGATLDDMSFIHPAPPAAV